MKTLCFETEIAGFKIRLHQLGRDRFSVVYGEELRVGMSYARAAQVLGESIMHALACEGKLDNREKGERQ